MPSAAKVLVLSDGVVTTSVKPSILSELYILSYIGGNTAQNQLVTFTDLELTLDERIMRAKLLCGKRNWRFVYLKAAVEVIS